MSFCIRSISCRTRVNSIRQNRAIVSAAGAHLESRYVEVTVETGDGVRGFGEAATTAIWSGETAESATAIINSLFAPSLVGHRFDHPEECLTRIDALCVASSFAKSSLDVAVWDAWARHQERSVADLLGTPSRLPAALPTRASLAATGVAETLRLAEAFVSEGVRNLKFKVGLAGYDDTARILAVRDRFGDSVRISVDANGGYRTVDAALRAIDTFGPLGVVLVEQPTPRGRLDLLAQVKRSSPLPIMADESIFDIEQLDAALAMDAFDVLSVYPGKNGGFGRALQMARRARAAGKACAVGSNLETDLGLAAMLALGSLDAFEPEAFPGDFASSLYYEKSSVRDPVRLTDGLVEVPRGAGFGVEPTL